jgi:hypothetical protein
MMNGKLDALKKLGSYVEGMEPAKEKEEGDEDSKIKEYVAQEMSEHGFEEEEATKVVMDHLAEDPQYYEKEEESEEDPNEAAEVKKTENEMADDGGVEEGPKISISMLARKPKGFQKKGK